MPLKNVCLVGGNGNLGTVFLDGLVASQSFSVSVAKRASSTSSLAHASQINLLPLPR
ncbi:hypothetical protein QQZ08_010829 [Neonectria magnoliae]|uniref:NmrA-like domain-containing protein n=1 Tax=Neonectria magnoliae TaxID=2732573 RepID=A0ABR1HEN9_9HYPO